MLVADANVMHGFFIVVQLTAYQRTQIFVRAYVSTCSCISSFVVHRRSQNRRRLHGGDRPHDQKVVGAMP